MPRPSPAAQRSTHFVMPPASRPQHRTPLSARCATACAGPKGCLAGVRLRPSSATKSRSRPFLPPRPLSRLRALPHLLAARGARGRAPALGEPAMMPRFATLHSCTMGPCATTTRARASWATSSFSRKFSTWASTERRRTPSAAARPPSSHAVLPNLGGALRAAPHSSTRFTSVCSASHCCPTQSSRRQEPEALSTWPRVLQPLFRTLYERGLRAHLLPYYGPWMWDPIDAESDLSRSISTNQFQSAARDAFRGAGQVFPRLGSHSFRRGRAAELFHGGISPTDLTRVLRHRSPVSSLPFVPESLRMTAAGAAMRAAAHRSAATSAAATAGRRTSRGAPPRGGHLPR